MNPIPNDPLADMATMHVWRDCVWAAPIHPHAKLVLLCIGRFADGEGKGSSMSYAQIARDCNISEPQAKKMVKAVRDLFLHVEVGKGRLVPKVGRENLYHVMAPPSVVDRVREQASKQAGVSNRDPDRGIQGTHVHCPVNQYRKIPVRTPHGSCGGETAAVAAATNVIPLDLSRRSSYSAPHPAPTGTDRSTTL
jgi:hypothetical protein